MENAVEKGSVRSGTQVARKVWIKSLHKWRRHIGSECAAGEWRKERRLTVCSRESSRRSAFLLGGGAREDGKSRCGEGQGINLP